MNEIKTGDRVKVRLAGRDWVTGNVKIASANAKSLALMADDKFHSEGGLFIDPSEGRQVILLMRDEAGQYRDLFTLSPYDVERV